MENPVTRCTVINLDAQYIRQHDNVMLKVSCLFKTKFEFSILLLIKQMAIIITYPLGPLQSIG